MATRFTMPLAQWISSLGVPGAGNKLYFYTTLTPTPLDTYSDDLLTVPNANPVVADSTGTWGPIFLQAADYKVVLTTAAGVQIGNPMDPVHGAVSASTSTFLATGTGAVSRTVQSKLRDTMSAADFGVVGNGVANDTAALQAALTAAWTANYDLFIPAGVYLVTGLTLPGNSTYRTKAFRMYGQGSGEIFKRELNAGTIITSVTDAPILIYTPDVANTGGGNIEIDHIRFEGSSTTPVVHLKSLYAQSSFHHNTIYQASTGNGFQCELSNTIEIHNNYAINRDWNTSVLGAARVGIGFYLFQTIATGLTSLRKNTSRGFLTAYKIGNNSGTAMYKTSIESCECSVTYNGIWLTPDAKMAYVNGCYLEGGDQGTGILDQGSYNTCSNNIIFSGYATALDSQADTYGSVYTGNTLAAASVAATTLLKIKSDGSSGGPGKIATGNTFTFSGSGGAITNVSAIIIYGIDPRLDLSSNVFDPRGNWTGGAGTSKISNQSTSGDGTTGTGQYGLGVATSSTLALECPHLGRGAINLAVEPAVLGAANISAGVLTVGQLSVFSLTLVGATNITSIAAGNLPDKTFMIRCTNALPTFVHDATKLAMSGSANYTPGANGAILTFQVWPGNIVREVARTAF